MSQADSPSTVPSCIICNKSNAARLCHQCRSSSYCSPECQKLDQPVHKLLCSRFSTYCSRPGPSKKRAILFPPDSKFPKIIWVECQEKENEGLTYECSQLQDHMGLGNAWMARSYIQQNLLRNRLLDHTIELTFLTYGSMQNKSIINATQRSAGHDWRGPVIAMRKKGLDTLFYEDITMAYYRDTVDGLILYSRLWWVVPQSLQARIGGLVVWAMKKAILPIMCIVVLHYLGLVKVLVPFTGDT